MKDAADAADAADAIDAADMPDAADATDVPDAADGTDGIGGIGGKDDSFEQARASKRRRSHPPSERRLDTSSFLLFVPCDESFFNATDALPQKHSAKMVRRNEDIITRALSCSSPPCDVECRTCWWDTEDIACTVRRKSILLERTRVMSAVGKGHRKRGRVAEELDVEVQEEQCSAQQACKFRCKFMGVFCSWECANSFDIAHMGGNHEMLIRYARMLIDGVPLSEPLRRHPSPYILTKFGGTVDTYTFRNWWILPNIVLRNASSDQQQSQDCAVDARQSAEVLPLAHADFDSVIDARWIMHARNRSVILNNRLQCAPAAPIDAPSASQFVVDGSHNLARVEQHRLDKHPYHTPHEHNVAPHRRAALPATSPAQSPTSSSSSVRPLGSYCGKTAHTYTHFPPSEAHSPPKQAAPPPLKPQPTLSPASVLSMQPLAPFAVNANKQARRVAGADGASSSSMRRINNKLHAQQRLIMSPTSSCSSASSQRSSKSALT